MANFHFKMLFTLCALSIPHTSYAEQKKPYINALELADNCREALKHPDKEFLQSYCAGIIQGNAHGQQALPFSHIPMAGTGEELPAIEKAREKAKTRWPCFLFLDEKWSTYERDIATNYVELIDFGLRRQKKSKDESSAEIFNWPGARLLTLKMMTWSPKTCNFMTEDMKNEFKQ